MYRNSLVKGFEMTIPAKLQSYMACGMPVLVAAGGESKRVIEEAACGFCTPSGDANALAESIIRMMQLSANKLQEMKSNSRNYFEENFEKQKLMDQIDQYFN